METNRWRSADNDSRYRTEDHRAKQDHYRYDQRQHHPARQGYPQGQSYQNRYEGYGSGQTHYGDRPDSVYRNPDINFGDNRNRPNQDYRSQRDSYSRPAGTSSRSPYAEDLTRPEQHHDDQIWTERNHYKDEDYRYRSGHRDTWRFYHEDEAAERHSSPPPRGGYRDRDEGFFDRLGNRISHAGQNFSQDPEQVRGGSYQNRPFNQGDTPAPRWGNEHPDDRSYPRRFYREEQDRRY